MLKIKIYGPGFALLIEVFLSYKSISLWSPQKCNFQPLGLNWSCTILKKVKLFAKFAVAKFWFSAYFLDWQIVEEGEIIKIGKGLLAIMTVPRQSTE
jgi:hypothetical protein